MSVGSADEMGEGALAMGLVHPEDLSKAQKEQRLTERADKRNVRQSATYENRTHLHCEWQNSVLETPPR